MLKTSGWRKVREKKIGDGRSLGQVARETTVVEETAKGQIGLAGPRYTGWAGQRNGGPVGMQCTQRSNRDRVELPKIQTK